MISSALCTFGVRKTLRAVLCPFRNLKWTICQLVSYIMTFPPPPVETIGTFRHSTQAKHATNKPTDWNDIGFRVREGKLHLPLPE